MNIVQINKFIEKIAGCTELVHSFYTDSVYECWNGSGDVDYGSFVFCIKKTRMRERTMIYDAIVYYGDRLLDDKSNRDAIWSDATNVIQSIIGAVNNVEGEISIGYPYEINLFEQKFADELAGAYANISIEVEGVGECADLLYGYENTGDDIKLESITKTFTVNGTYDIVAGEDYDAISDVKVIVDIPLQEKSIEITHNGHYNVSPDEGYEGVTNVDIEVEIPLQSKSVNIDDNGSYTITADEGYDGITEVDINVDIPLQEKSVKFVEAGFYEVVPDDDYKALTKVNVEVSFEGKQIIPNGFRFTGGDMALVEWDKYDWSMVYDTPEFFASCTGSDPSWTKKFEDNFNGEFYNCYRLFNTYNGSSIPNIDTSNATNMSYMFNGCKNLISVPPMDTSKVTTMESAFRGCSSLQSIPPMDTSNATNMSYMFNGCKNLISVPPMDTSKVTTMYYMFNECSNLISVPPMDTSKVTTMGGIFWKCSSLQSIPPMDMSSVTNMANMFEGCVSLENITLYNVIGVSLPSSFTNCTKLKHFTATNCIKTTSLSQMFRGLKNLETVNLSGTQNVKSYYDAFGSSSKLKSVSGLDITSCTNFNYVFQGCYELEEVRMIGEPSPSMSVGAPFSLIKTNGTLYYDDRYDYSNIINVIPETWTAIPYTVME